MSKFMRFTSFSEAIRGSVSLNEGTVKVKTFTLRSVDRKRAGIS